MTPGRTPRQRGYPASAAVVVGAEFALQAQDDISFRYID